jgi:hypothetical protein
LLENAVRFDAPYEEYLAKSGRSFDDRVRAKRVEMGLV